MTKIHIPVTFFDATLEPMTFEKLAQLWYENIEPYVQPSTYCNYAYTLEKLIEAFGKFMPEEIVPYHIEQYQKAANSVNLSVSYQRKLRGMMYQIMQMAVSGGICKSNPVKGAQTLKRIRVSVPIESRSAYTQREIRQLMEVLPYDRMGLTIRLLIFSGLRGQELLGLEQRHISPDGSSIIIEQAVKMKNGVAYIGPPKSSAGYRVVPIPLSIRPYAATLRENAGHFVWPGKNDAEMQPYNPTSWRRLYYKTLCAIPGLRVLSPHCCRHTYVSQLHAMGVSMETIQVLVGHSDVDMTQNYYHVQDEEKENALIKLNALLS